MNRIILFVLLASTITACGKRRKTIDCSAVLCAGPIIFSVQITDSQGRSLHDNSQLAKYYSSLVVKSYNYSNTIDTVKPDIDSQGVIQYTMRDASKYVFLYNGATSDTFNLYRIIPLVANSNPCCPDYGSWTVLMKDTTYAPYQGQIIRIKKPV